VNKITVINNIDIVFAAIIGILYIKIPYESQNIRPISIIIIIVKDKSFVCFDFIDLIVCGRYANVVNTPAVSPRISINVSNNYCIMSLTFRPASFDVLWITWFEPGVGSIFVYL
jgi:hypothetical protein